MHPEMRSVRPLNDSRSAYLSVIKTPFPVRPAALSFATISVKNVNEIPSRRGEFDNEWNVEVKE